MPINHTVQPGDCLCSIAHQFGFANWKTLYDDDGNAALRSTRSNPNVLRPGDKVCVPNKTAKDEASQTFKHHTFRLAHKRTRLRIVLCDQDGRPLAGKKYTLVVGDASSDGNLDADGLLDEGIAPDAVAGVLTVWSDDTDPDHPDVFSLNLGGLVPVDDLVGVQSRLNNLGFDCGEVDGISGPRTEAAVRAFQKAQGLKIDGIPGNNTQAALQQQHGC